MNADGNDAGGEGVQIQGDGGGESGAGHALVGDFRGVVCVKGSGSSERGQTFVE